MDIPKLAARKLITTPEQITKGYVLGSWADLHEAELWMTKTAGEWSRVISKSGPLSIGFTFNYGTPTLDLFVIKTPYELTEGAAWSEVAPFRIRQGSLLSELDNFEDFCETEQRILEAERVYRELCLKTPGQGAKVYNSTYPLLDDKLIDSRCQCVLDTPYKPFNK